MVGEGKTGRESKFQTKKGPGRWVGSDGERGAGRCRTAASDPPDRGPGCPSSEACLHPAGRAWRETGGALDDGNGGPLRPGASQWPSPPAALWPWADASREQSGEGKAGLSGGVIVQT